MVWAFLVLLVLIAGYLVFEYGRISAGYDTLDAANERGELVAHIDALDDEIEALQQDGLEAVAGVGHPFDPAVHEAVSVIPGEGEQIVHQELRKGYVMRGRVIRPTLVIVGHA